jgi:hypothetical protein
MPNIKSLQDKTMKAIEKQLDILIDSEDVYEKDTACKAIDALWQLCLKAGYDEAE